MLHDPATLDAEAFRRLRTNVEFANLDVDAKVIMVTSATGGEGKSRTISNLAIAFARSGRRVALVDLDLRRPTIGRYFGFGLRPGITDVAINRIELDQGLVNVPLWPEDGVHAAPGSPRSLASTRGRQGGSARGELTTRPEELTGELVVLPAGFPPANPGEFVGTEAVAEILETLKERSDFVLVDSPPLLPVSDGATLSTRVDAVLVVARLGVVNRSTLRELARQLDATRAHHLGAIVTGAEAPEQYGGAYAPPPAGTGTARQVRPRPVPLPSPEVHLEGSDVLDQRRSAAPRQH
jgi:Mrp family chromosome partitioning ATPase